MKLFAPKLRRLNQQGVSHFVLPLAVLVIAGVVGTFALVSKNSQELTTQTTAATGGAAFDPKKDTTPKGFLLLYGEDGGIYKKAVIRSSGSTDKLCGKKKLPLVVNLKKTTPVKLQCNSGNTYQVYFLKKGQKTKQAKGSDPSKYTAVALTEKTCSFVHKRGVTRVETIDAQGRCKGDNDPDESKVTQKLKPIVKAGYTPSTVTIGKAYAFEVDVQVPNETLSVEECAGTYVESETFDFKAKKAKSAKSKYEGGLYYNAKRNSCYIKYTSSAKESKQISPLTVTGTIKFSGNRFLEPATGEYTANFVKK